MFRLNLPRPIAEARLPSDPAERSEGRRRWASRGRQRAAGPEPRHGRRAGAADPGRAPRVAEVRAECVSPPGRRARARAVAHSLRLEARTTSPLGRAVPRRFDQASTPGRKKGDQGSGAGVGSGGSWRERPGGKDRPDSTSYPTARRCPTFARLLKP